MVLKTCPICQARVSPVDCGERWCDLYGVTSTASSSARRVAPLCKKNACMRTMRVAGGGAASGSALRK